MVYRRLYFELDYPAKHNFPSLSTPVGQRLRARFVIHNSGMRMARMWNVRVFFYSAFIIRNGQNAIAAIMLPGAWLTICIPRILVPRAVKKTRSNSKNPRVYIPHLSIHHIYLVFSWSLPWNVVMMLKALFGQGTLLKGFNSRRLPVSGHVKS